MDAAVLSSLHRRYDGPVPAALRDAARNGGSEALRQVLALAESRALDRRAAGCRAAACRARDHGQTPAATLHPASTLRDIRAAAIALRQAPSAG
jgi:hypothetical protein